MQEQLDTLINTTVTGLGYDLWGYEYRPQQESALLRVFIDAEDGITVDDCGKVSNQLSAALDVDDLIPVAYILEVSSPGMDRVLFVPAHFARYLGEQIKVRTRLPVEKRRNFVGKLLEVDDEKISMQVEGNRYTIPHDIIDRARLVLDIRPQRKGGKHA
ncbi:MAG TPA: ribosome maturation factor RimP [Candidatus Thiothrix moscowensis]|uniref:ribosome maturation factor RimP n=1 Tax=unclassified Thiothrix TaxID=2636184 RepID=UPI001A20790C|nr:MULTISPECIES: ribosome maturation factor RimP [unclassified Thiothrix]MBJ6609030.1 ribosome maturation factor RimP [Candidatus Thiothrix moscowensis]HRJ53366.1 ribosome maturation factor RimP [Candidatus Thiothrix moscowensis]HRJ94657.1 ribosome maturation factor RimP [Candidatus Thiothrix moscowensis]